MTVSNNEIPKPHIPIPRTVQVGWQTLGSGIGQLSTALLVILLVRLLSKTEYGVYRQLLLVIAMLSPLFTLALPSSLLYFIASEPIPMERQRLVGQTLLLLVTSGMIMGSIVFFCAAPISRYFSNAAMADHLRILSLYPVFLLPSRCFSPALLALGHPRSSGTLLALQGASKAVIVLSIVLAGGGLEAMSWGLVASAGLNLVVGCMISTKRLGVPFAIQLDTTKIARQISYSLPLGVAAIVIAWGLRVDQLLISTYFNPMIFAIYAVGATEIPFISLLQASINSVILPELTRLIATGQRASAVHLWSKVFDRSALVTFPAFFFMLLVSEGLVIGLFSEDYSASVQIFRIYLAIIPLRVMTFGLLLRAVGRTTYDLWGSGISLAVNVGLAIILLKLIGVSGPAWSTVVALIILVGYLVAKTRKQLRWTIGEILPWKVILTNLTIAGLPLLATVVIRNMLVGVLSFSLQARTGITGLVYVITYLVAVRMVSKERFSFLLTLATFRWLVGDLRQTNREVGGSQ